MLKTFAAGIATAALLTLPVIAVAEQGAKKEQQKSSSQSQATGETVRVASASSLIGKSVLDVDDRVAGDVRYVMVDIGSGHLRYAIIAPQDGAEQLNPIPWDALQVSRDGDQLRLSVKAERLSAAPTFSQEELAQATKPQVITEVYRYWAPVEQRFGQAMTRPQSGESPSGQAQSGQSAEAAQQSAEANEPYQSGQAQADVQERLRRFEQAEPGRQTQQAQQGEQQALERSRQAQPEGQDEASRREAAPHMLVGRTVIATLVAPHLRFTDQIQGSRVTDKDGTDLGEIDDLMLDLERGRIAYVQLSQGGFLGMGEEITPVPFEALHYDAEQEAYGVSLGAEKLRQMERFAKGAPPHSIRKSELEDLYRRFDVAPYWNR